MNRGQTYLETELNKIDFLNNWGVKSTGAKEFNPRALRDSEAIRHLGIAVNLHPFESIELAGKVLRKSLFSLLR
jgi:hypothetical protein